MRLVFQRKFIQSNSAKLKLPLPLQAKPARQAINSAVISIFSLLRAPASDAEGMRLTIGIKAANLLRVIITPAEPHSRWDGIIADHYPPLPDLMWLANVVVKQTPRQDLERCMHKLSADLITPDREMLELLASDIITFDIFAE